MGDQAIWVLAHEDDAWFHSLAVLGRPMMRFPDASALAHAADRQDASEPAALVLLADVASNCQAAQSARFAWPTLNLAARQRQAAWPEQAALLSSGVDCVLRPDDPPTLLASVLAALDYRRIRFGATAQSGSFMRIAQAMGGPRIGPWRLADGGWVLKNQDAALRLTVSERAILLCLFDAPGHVVSHADLLAAVLQVWQPRRQARIRDPRCRSTISRLRRRAEAAGMPTPPIESLRDFGYVWAL